MQPIIKGHGYGAAKILFVAGHPLSPDLQTGLALSGTSETTLDQFLRAQKLNIKQTYRTLYIKEKLEYAGTNSRRLREALAKVYTVEYNKILMDEIKEVQPNVIVPLDDISLSVVYPHIDPRRGPGKGKRWIDAYRGSILPFNDKTKARRLGDERFIKVIPTYGPQFLYANWPARSYISVDYTRIAKYSETEEEFKSPGLVWVAKTNEALISFLARQYAKVPKMCTFDVETYGGMITCISFCFDGYEAVSVPLSFTNEISIEEKAELWRTVSKILADERTEKNNQNIKFDWTLLERHGFVINNVVHDTMLKAGLLYPELPKNLGFLTSLYTEIPYFKDEGKNFDPRLGKDQLYLYNAKDSLAAHIISEEQDKELKELDNNAITLP